jgi:hypothetical protein
MLPLAPVQPHFVLGHRISQHKTLLVGNNPNFQIVYRFNFTATTQGCSLTLWILAEGLRNERLKDPWTPLESPGRSALLNATKLIISLAIYLWRRRGEGKLKEDHDEEHLLDDQATPPSSGWQPSRHVLHVWTGRSIMGICVVAALYVLRDHTVRLPIILHIQSNMTPYPVLCGGTTDRSFCSISRHSYQYLSFNHNISSVLHSDFLRSAMACRIATGKQQLDTCTKYWEHNRAGSFVVSSYFG